MNCDWLDGYSLYIFNGTNETFAPGSEVFLTLFLSLVHMLGLLGDATATETTQNYTNINMKISILNNLDSHYQHYLLMYTLF